jgi:beta-galactosidase/beta-glucuronidase
MKTNVILSILFFLFVIFPGRTQSWHPVECALPTPWSDSVSVDHPWPEYPRPQMVREEWKNLNGLWDYGIRKRYEEQPQRWDGQIRVPFPVESCLSGVKKRVDEEQVIWYRRKFSVPAAWQGCHVLLHVEASDWETKVWVNGRFVGVHQGGYDPFSFDITGQLTGRGEQEVVMAVWDPTDQGTQPRGKQVSHPRGIWYTPTSGIWQTVWLEPVPEHYLTSYRVYPDPGKGEVRIMTSLARPVADAKVAVTVCYDGKEIVSGTGRPKEVTLTLPQEAIHLWTPEHPGLYDLQITLLQEGKTTDRISGYFGMRSVSLDKDNKGRMRMMLNGAFLFQNGPLDQGFWPDGIYTPPTEEAMRYDLEMIKEMGFNMLRKHVKVESRRFYYWCDRMGLLVWQDMPSGDRYIRPDEPDIVRTEASARQFKEELSRMILTKFNHPSIIMWVAFNEGWGQFDTPGIVEYIRALDPTRLVDAASGWSDRGVGDVYDIHHYPDPKAPEPQTDRAIVLGEYGGLGLPVTGHTWVKKNWGYRKMSDVNELKRKYHDYFGKILKMKTKPGLSACVYTQITDVETETNGLMTYDRKVTKIKPEEMRKMNDAGADRMSGKR